MSLSRRAFLVAAGGGLLALGGCTPFGLSDAPDLPASWPAVPPGDALGHLLRRCSFGPRPGDHQAALAGHADADAAADAWLERQLDPDSIADPGGDRLDARFRLGSLPPGEAYEYRRHLVADELVRECFMRAVRSERQLLEVMTHQWMDHFNVAAAKADCAWLLPSYLRRVIRPHALGDFASLVRSVTLSPAMLWYLDGRENRVVTPADIPNENHARELLELHTLGVEAGYTQRDIQELARCLTGWSVRGDGDFGCGTVAFDPRTHDDGAKLVLGERIPAGLGARDVDVVIGILVRRPECARHVARRLCRRFIADEPPAAAVDAVAQRFADTRGDLADCLRALIATPAFTAARGTKLKRPFHYAASLVRACGADLDHGRDYRDALTALGHKPFQHPTPDGYPQEAAAWRDGLLWRWRLAHRVATGQMAGTRVELRRLVDLAGGAEGLVTRLWGRAPSAEELATIGRDGPDSLAAALAAPAFLRC